MECVVRFSVENAAFDDNRPAAIAACLAEVTRMISAGHQHGKIRDANGNVIGRSRCDLSHFLIKSGG